MTDFYAKRVNSNGSELWKIYEVGSNQVIAVGSTITQAVDNYFTYEANKEAEKNLGTNIDDLSF